MSKFYLLAFVVLLGAGCVPSAVEYVPTIEGRVIAGFFGGTEMGCDFSEDGAIGYSRPCNSGTVALGVETADLGSVWLIDSHCGATEVFTKTEKGTEISYETSNCDPDMTIGDFVQVKGDLKQQRDQWRNGKQVDEWWIKVDDFKIVERVGE